MRRTVHRNGDWSCHWPVGLAVCIGLGVTLAAFYWIRDLSWREMQDIFDRGARDRASQIEGGARENESLINFRSAFSASRKKGTNAKCPAPPSLELAYCNLSSEPFDFLGEVVSTMGIQLTECDMKSLGPDENVLVNCIWAGPHRLAAHNNSRSGDGVKLIVSDAEDSKPYSRFGRVLSVPTSYAALRWACQNLAQPMRGAPATSLATPGVSAGTHRFPLHECSGGR